MNVNSPSIARRRAASRLESSVNLRRARCKTIEFRTPHVGPPLAMQNVNHNAAITSKSSSADSLVQNTKITERQTLLLPRPKNRDAEVRNRRKQSERRIAHVSAQSYAGLRSAELTAEARPGTHVGRRSLFPPLPPVQITNVLLFPQTFQIGRVPITIVK
jgi:hypothetical protein